jgi:hypothetical protein
MFYGVMHMNRQDRQEHLRADRRSLETPPYNLAHAKVNTIAHAITLHNQHINIVANAVVFFDGLPRSKQDEVATAL